jgi:hypothetical protein
MSLLATGFIFFAAGEGRNVRKQSTTAFLVVGVAVDS